MLKFLTSARGLNFILLVVILALAMILIRENEGRTAAEKKLNDMHYQYDSNTVEKDNAIMSLQNNIDDLQAKLVEASKQYKTLDAQKEQEIADLTADRQSEQKNYQTAIAQKEDEYQDLQTRSKAEADKYENLVKDKNSEIDQLTSQLETTSNKVKELLKKQQALEAQNIEHEKTIANFKSSLKKSERKNTDLAAKIKELETKLQQVAVD